MNQTRVKIESLLKISHDLTFDEQDIKGSVRLKNESDISLLNEFNDGLIDDLSFKLNVYRFSIGDDVQYTLSLYRTDDQFASYQNFIFHQFNFNQNPILAIDYIIYEEFHDINKGELAISNNLKLFSEFIKILSEKYFYRESQIILFSKTHCEINIQPRNYQKYIDLAKVYNDLKLDVHLRKIITWLSSENQNTDENLSKALAVHQSERYSIAATEFIDNLITLDKNERVFNLLKNIDVIYQAILSKYSLYLDNFKFSKFTDKITKYSEEFLNKVNKVITDLQTQILAIPLAVSAITLLKDSEKNNSFIYLGFLIYLLIVFYSSCQQAYNLSHISIQIKQFNEFAKLPKDLSAGWEKEINPVKRKILCHRIFLLFISIFIGILIGYCINNIDIMINFLYKINYFYFFIFLFIFSYSLKIILKYSSLVKSKFLVVLKKYK